MRRRLWLVCLSTCAFWERSGIEIHDLMSALFQGKREFCYVFFFFWSNIMKGRPVERGGERERGETSLCCTHSVLRVHLLSWKDIFADQRDWLLLKLHPSYLKTHRAAVVAVVVISCFLPGLWKIVLKCEAVSMDRRAEMEAVWAGRCKKRVSDPPLVQAGTMQLGLLPVWYWDEGLKQQEVQLSPVGTCAVRLPVSRYHAEDLGLK